MTLKDVSNGPDWVIWVVFAIFLILSVVFLLGKGGFLIAGYNTMTAEEKQKYDEKKLCRIVGGGMLIIAVLIAVMGIGEDVLPASFANVFGGLVIADVIAMLILMRKFGRK